MTKKDYIKFADMIAKQRAKEEKAYNQYYEKTKMINVATSSDAYYEGRDDVLHEMINKIIELFKQDNPAFDEDRFNQYIEQKVKSLLE